MGQFNAYPVDLTFLGEATAVVPLEQFGDHHVAKTPADLSERHLDLGPKWRPQGRGSPAQFHALSDPRCVFSVVNVYPGCCSRNAYLSR